MANPRFGLYNNGVVSMFPRSLMNSAVSPTLLSGAEYARYLENVLPNTSKAGSGAKRFGTGDKGDEVASVNGLKIFEYRTSAGGIEFLQYYDDGSIRRLNESTGAWTSLKSGLSANGLPGALPFNEKLVIYDGVNTPMAYDGSTITELAEFVVDFDSGSSLGLATAATQTDTNTFTITVGSGRSDYEVGQSIKVTFDTAGEVSATISNVSGSGTLTIDVDGTPFPSPTETITKVEYETSPPAFSFMWAEHNRLWGLSAGVTRAKTFRSRADAMKVFYNATTNNEALWVDEDSQEVSFVSLQNRSPAFDELVAISSLDGLLVFFGRQSTFIFSGDDPTTAGGFVFVKRVPVGCINSQLVITYPSDILFFTRYGARSLRRVFETEQLEASPDLGSSVDPTVTELIASMVVDDATFRKARSFFYEPDGFYGFSFGGDTVLVYALSEESKGWTQFTGSFANATAFLGTSDGRLLLTVGGQMMAYANGTDSDVGTLYGDDGANITVKWWTPWLRISRGGRWSNVGYELLVEDTATGTVSIFRAVDENDDTMVLTPVTIALTEDSAFWDEAFWDEDAWDGARKRLVVRDKFLADSFSLLLVNESTEGPISFLGVRPIGR